MPLPIRNALILFSDIIDSSVYSSILGIERYAKDLQKFQQKFKELAKQHFKSPSALKNTFVKTESAGDEGTVFCVIDEKSNISPGELIYRAIQFSYELKAQLDLTFEVDKDKVPRKMQVGTGIHFGEVATVLKDGNIKSPSNVKTDLKDIEGYTINYTKRIESASRQGMYSKVFLSQTANSYLWAYPILTEKHMIDLKGISKNSEAYEIRSVFFKDMKLNYPKEIISSFLQKYVVNPSNLDLINEPWLKSYVISVLESIRDADKYKSIASKYYKKQIDFAWHSPVEDDPILLLLRSLECKRKKQHTRRIKILKDICDQFPSFIFAKKELVKAFGDLVDFEAMPAELVYARDMANELIERHTEILKGEDEIAELEGIVNKLKPKLKQYE